MARKRIFSPYSYVTGTASAELVDPLSVTVPNEAMSVQDILQRHVNGQVDPTMFKTPVYFGGDLDSPDLEEFQRMDPAERMAEIENNAERIKTLKAERQTQILAEELAREKAALAAEEKLASKFYAKFKGSGTGKQKGRLEAPGTDDGNEA